MHFVTRVCFVILFVSLPITALCQGQPASSPSPANRTESIVVNAQEKGSSFPHFWEKMFGSGQAILALRDSYRKDMRLTKGVTEFQYVRFHDILGDQVGIYTPDEHRKGNPPFNYSYVDQIYDGLLAEGVRPFVELSFMPNQMAATPKPAQTWYEPNEVTLPKDYALWDAMIRDLVCHLVEHYGIEEVSQWYFEVWNEPDDVFPEPKLKNYLVFYDHTARDVKSVDGRLRVGGPATSHANWVSTFLSHCHDNQIPIDFVSTHVYGDGSTDLVTDGTSGPELSSSEVIPRNQLVGKQVAKIHREIEASATPRLPLIVSEFNASWMLDKSPILDTVYMGPWLADTIRQCDGLVDMMSYWTFSDVFEEEGVVRKPFYGGFGIIAEDNIPKPAFNAFALLHKLGDLRLHADSESALVTRRNDGSLAIALWNYAEPATSNRSAPDPAKTFALTLAGISRHATAHVWRVDDTHGNVLQAFDAMGQPSWPTQKQIKLLQDAAQLPAAESKRLENGHLNIEVPARGLVLLEVR